MTSWPRAVFGASVLGNRETVNIRKVIQRRLRHRGEGVDVVGDVNAVIAANLNERGGSSSVSSRQRVVQRDGRTVVSETETSTGSEGEGGTR